LDFWINEGAIWGIPMEIVYFFLIARENVLIEVRRVMKKIIRSFKKIELRP